MTGAARLPSRSPPSHGALSATGSRVAPFTAPSLAALANASSTAAAAVAPTAGPFVYAQPSSQRRAQPVRGPAPVLSTASHAHIGHSHPHSHAPSSTSSSARSRSSAAPYSTAAPPHSAASYSTAAPVHSTVATPAASAYSTSAYGHSAASRRATPGAAAASSSSSSSSSSTGPAARPAPSAALIAAALQSQFMSTMKVSKPGSAQSALSQAKKRAAASLAQQLGLVPAPAPKLTKSEWSAVHDRARARGETAEPCPICQEEFRDSEQVLLSCTHVFHAVCLRNFERFSGTKVCPICRGKEYEKKLINDAAVDYKEKCAIKIQSRYRGYVIRKQYLQMLELIPPKDAARRKEFFMKKLSANSTKLAQLMENRDTAIDALFADIDKSVMQVRDSLSAAAVQLKTFSPEEWTAIRRQATLRAELECPICCCAFDDATTVDDDSDGVAHHPTYESMAKRRVLLSCSHALHHGCLLSFERFTIASCALDGADHSALQRQQTQLESLHGHGDGESLLQPPPACLCPLCRSNYQKTWF